MLQKRRGESQLSNGGSRQSVLFFFSLKNQVKVHILKKLTCPEYKSRAAFLSYNCAWQVFTT